MMESEQKKKKGCSSTCKRVLGILALCLSTLAYAAKVSISIYAWWGQPSRIGLKLSLQDAFTTFQLPISPANWTQALWLVIFLWEGLCILFTWRFAFNRFIPRTVYGAFYPAYSLACVAHIGWVFSWGRLIQELSLVLVALLTLLLMLCVGIASVHLYFIRGSFKFYYQCNFWLTRLLVLNGAVAYATFSLILTLFNLGAVLTVNAGLLGETASTIVLSLLSSIVVTYFLLENTIFDRFLRYVFAVYPVVLWMLIGVLTQIWKGRESTNNRNELFSLVLACVVGFLILIRIFLWMLFMCIRPLKEHEGNKIETVPL